MRIIRLFLIFMFSIVVVSCGGGGGGGVGGSGGGVGGSDTSGIDITDSASLSQASSFKNGTRRTGASPVPAGASGSQMEGPTELALTTNSVTELTYEVALPDSDSKIGAVLIEFENSDEYFVVIPEDIPRTAGREIPTFTAHSDLANEVLAYRQVCATRAPPCEGIRLTAQPLNSGGFSTPVTTRANVSSVIVQTADLPDFSNIPFAQIQPDPTRWTEPTQIDVRATPTGSGDFQVTLVWDSTADMDLHIFEPSGIEIAWDSPASPKGFLDVDDVDGFGPENVFYEDGHDAGNYRIEVHHFSGAVPTSYTVTITENGSTTSYSGSVTSAKEEDVVTTISTNGSESTGTGSSGGSSSGGSSGGGTGTANFCYDNYPSEPCDLLVTEGGSTSSNFTTSNTCSGLGYSGETETFDFGTQFGSFGQSSTIGTVGTCEVTF